MKDLFEALSFFEPLSPKVAECLRPNLVYRYVKEGEYILRAGDINRYIYFIEKGRVRVSYWLHDKDITSWLLKQGDFLISVPSFFKQKKAYEDIQALEDTILIGLSYDHLNDACRKHPEFLWNRIFITEHYYELSDAMNFLNRWQTPLDKFEQLMKTDPSIIHDVHLKYIYSYLGISKATYERMYKKYLSNQKSTKKK